MGGATEVDEAAVDELDETADDEALLDEVAAIEVLDLLAEDDEEATELLTAGTGTLENVVKREPAPHMVVFAESPLQNMLHSPSGAAAPPALV